MDSSLCLLSKLTALSLVPDPHVWHDANHGVAVVEVIQAQLAQLSPEHADLYEKNAAAIQLQRRFPASIQID